ncbi:hypothetical protein FKM82_023490 [Ascaphus truei]
MYLVSAIGLKAPTSGCLRPPFSLSVCSLCRLILCSFLFQIKLVKFQCIFVLSFFPISRGSAWTKYRSFGKETILTKAILPDIVSGSFVQPANSSAILFMMGYNSSRITSAILRESECLGV